MKKFLLLLAAIVSLCSCVRTGLTKQMSGVLDNVEENLSYVNTYDEKDMVKMAAWFDRHGNDSEKARALYCLGRYQFNARSYSAAIVSCTRALEYAEKASDTLSAAKICYDMGHISNASGNTSDEILYLARSSEAFNAAGKRAESLQALLEAGKAQSDAGQYDSAEKIFKSVLFDSHAQKDTLLESKCLEAYASLAVSKDSIDPALAIDLLSRASDDLGYPLSSSDKGILAYSYSVAGKTAEAEKWLAEAKSSAESDSETAEADFREYQVLTREGNYKNALAALEKVLEYGNKTQAASLEDAVATSQREYIEEQASMKDEQLKTAHLRMWVMALGALLALAAVMAIFLARKAEERRRLEEEKAETEKYMGIAEDLQARLSAAQKRLPSEKYLSLEKFDALERLCEQYYVYEGTENLQPKILKEVKSIVEGLRKDGKTQKELENMLDRNMDGVMTKLRSEYPVWKEEDFLLYGFAAAGFSNTTISTLMEKEKSVIYNRIWRLKGRISASGSSLKDFFLKCLED